MPRWGSLPFCVPALIVVACHPREDRASSESAADARPVSALAAASAPATASPASTPSAPAAPSTRPMPASTPTSSARAASSATNARFACGTKTCAADEFCVEMHRGMGIRVASDDPRAHIEPTFSCQKSPPPKAGGVRCDPTGPRTFRCAAKVS